MPCRQHFCRVAKCAAAKVAEHGIIVACNRFRPPERERLPWNLSFSNAKRAMPGYGSATNACWVRSTHVPNAAAWCKLRHPLRPALRMLQLHRRQARQPE